MPARKRTLDATTALQPKRRRGPRPRPTGRRIGFSPAQYEEVQNGLGMLQALRGRHDSGGTGAEAAELVAAHAENAKLRAAMADHETVRLRAEIKRLTAANAQLLRGQQLLLSTGNEEFVAELTAFRTPREPRQTRGIAAVKSWTKVPLLVTIHAEKFVCDHGCGLCGCYAFVAAHELDCKGMQYPSTF